MRNCGSFSGPMPGLVSANRWGCYRKLKGARPLRAGSCGAEPSILVYLDISVEADSGVIHALQAFKRHRTLLLIVDEEDEDPPCEVEQHTDRSCFSDAAVRPAWSQREKLLDGSEVLARTQSWLISFPYRLVCELLCMNQERLLSTYMAQALSSFPSITSFSTSARATPKAGSGWLS